MFDLPKRLKNYAIEHFLKDNPKNRDFLSYWQTDEEIDIRFRNLYQQLQHALIERNYEMEQQLYEMACPKGYTERLLDDYMNTNSAEALSLEKEEERLRAHAKKYLRRKLNSAALLSTTTANPNIEMDVITDPDMNVEHVETCWFRYEIGRYELQLVSTYSSSEDTPRKLSFNFDDIDHVETCARYFFFIKPFIRTVQITLWNSLTVQHQIYVRENSQHTVG